MEKLTPKSTKGFKIPAELMKAFQGELRFLPPNLHVYGYIMFDRAMLASILRNSDAATREQFAAALQTLDPQCELVLVASSEATAAAGQ